MLSLLKRSEEIEKNEGKLVAQTGEYKVYASWVSDCVRINLCITSALIGPDLCVRASYLFACVQGLGRLSQYWLLMFRLHACRYVGIAFYSQATMQFTKNLV